MFERDQIQSFAEGVQQKIQDEEMLTSPNPKAAYGAAKAPFIGVPPTALVQLGLVMGGGAHKYGLYNFRSTRINASTYIDAIYRHFLKYQDGVDCDKESGATELAHIMACCAILIDGHYTGMIIDDRCKTGLVEPLLEDSAHLFGVFKENYNESST